MKRRDSVCQWLSLQWFGSGLLVLCPFGDQGLVGQEAGGLKR